MANLNYWQLLAGITVFIFSMSLMEDSLKNISGRAFKKFLQRQTASRLRALFGGTIVTAALQSSSLVVLMILSFIGARIMTMNMALAVVLGSNLGTTLNSWIIATVGFNMELNSFAYPLLAICIIGFLLFPRNSNIRSLVNFLIGISLLFIGIEWMKTSTLHLQQNFDFDRFAKYSPYWLIIIGFAITLIFQFSSVTFAITLTAVQSGTISITGGACMVIGAELGTTVKFLLTSLSGISDQKRLAVANFIFNLATMIVAVILVHLLLEFIQKIIGIKDPFIALASFQTILNLISIGIFFPWLGRFAGWMERWIKDSQDDLKLQYLKRSGDGFPDNAVGLAEKEVLRLLNSSTTVNSLWLAMGKTGEANASVVKRVLKRIFRPVSISDSYNLLKIQHGEILDYLVDYSSQQNVPQNFERAEELIAILDNILLAAKSVKDIAHNLEDMRTSANDELFGLFNSIKVSERKFYDDLGLISGAISPSGRETDIARLSRENKVNYDRNVTNTLHLLNENKITRINATTVLNVHREIYSSHKAILKALEAL